MITFKDFAGNARKKKKKQAGKQKKAKKLGVRSSQTMQVKLAQGRRVFDYIGEVIKTAAERQHYYKEGFRMPKGFWRQFFKLCLHSSQVNKNRVMMYKRHYNLFMQRRRAGETGYYRILAGPQGHQGHSQGIQPNILGFPKASSQTLWVFPGLSARQSGFPQGFQPNLLGFLKVSPP